MSQSKKIIDSTHKWVAFLFMAAGSKLAAYQCESCKLYIFNVTSEGAPEDWCYTSVKSDRSDYCECKSYNGISCAEVKLKMLLI